MKQKHLIALFMPGSGIWHEIALGFHEAAVSAGWMIWAFTELQSYNLDLLKCRDVHAILIGSTWRREILSSGFGRKVVLSVVADLAAQSIPSVCVDDAAAGVLAADHLLDQGQRDFSAFGWREPFFLTRTSAFEQRVIERSGRFHTRWNPSDRRFEPGENEAFERSIHDWIRSLPRPVAILAGSDTWGRLLNVLLYRWGIRVPEDVAVIGVGNETLVCETSIPPLTSVAVPWRKIGAEAARLMVNALASPKREKVPVSPVLVPPSGVIARRSSDMLAVTDNNVADALRVIRNHATEQLSVSDILRHVPIGRHALQRAFRKHVGRTILDEIRRVRVERAKSILATTDLSMPEVAMRSGFCSAPRFSDMFRRETGTTPGSYRRTFRTR